MDADYADELNEITRMVIGCAFKVSNNLGCGFLEKVYENALAHELRKAGLGVKQQYQIKVYYDGIVVGNYEADLLVEDSVILELKAVKNLTDRDEAQCVSYLKASKLKIGLLINFGNPKAEIKRIVNRF